MTERDSAKDILGTIKADRVYNIPGEHDVFLDHGTRYLHYVEQVAHGG